MRHDRSLVIAGLSLVAAAAMSCQTGAPASGTATGAAPSTPATSSAMPPNAGPSVQAATMEEAGEYLTLAGSCNDCHTQGWVESKGTVPPADRFAGMNVGFRGDWGTTYAKNLRTVVQRQSEDHWVTVLKTQDEGDGKPPMPWWNTAKMNERDLRAMYRYIKSLGPNTKTVPRAVPPGRDPTGPYIWVTPKTGP